MASTESWERAMQAILAYYANELNYKTTGKNAQAYIGDVPPDDVYNVMLFIISGGPVQDQNFQCTKGGRGYLADGLMLGQFKNRPAAMKFAGRVMASTPPKENAASTGVANRGLAPNVDLCEITGHPELFSREIATNEDGSEFVTWWLARIPFRVVYNNNVD